MTRKKYKGPSEYRPVSSWGYYGLSLLYLIPVIGWVCFLVFTFEGSNINRRNYTRSIWCRILVRLIILVLIAATLMIALRIPPAEVPARVRGLIESTAQVIRNTASGQSAPYTPDSADKISVTVDGRTLSVHTDVKQTLDKCETLVDTFIDMANQGKTGQSDLMGLAMANLDTGIKAVSIYQSELEPDDKAYLDAVMARTEEKLSAIDMASIDLSWFESSSLPRLLGLNLP